MTMIMIALPNIPVPWNQEAFDFKIECTQFVIQ